MKTYIWLCSIFLASSVAIYSNHAKAQPVDVDSLPKVSCSELVYSQEFLTKYPKAPAACIEARVAKGKRYAKFNGKVYIPGADVITVQMFNVAGDPLSTFSFRPSPKARVIVNGQPKPFSELRKGDPITFWVSEKRFAVYTAPGASGVSKVVAPR
jgi:hypothetical protein